MTAFAASSVIRDARSPARSRPLAMIVGLFIALVIAVTLGVSPAHADGLAANAGLTVVEAANPAASGDISAPESGGCACACVAHATGTLPATLAGQAPSMGAVIWSSTCSTYRPGGEVPLLDRPPRS